MPALTPFDHLLALALAVFFPIRAVTFGYRRLADAPETAVPRVRRALYAQALLIQWTLAASVGALWVWQARGWDSLGLVWHTDLRSLLVAGSALVFIALIASQLRRALNDPDTLAGIRGRLAHIERMLPRSLGELRAFLALSFTAGVCEELLYRGFMVWYLNHFLPLAVAAAVAIVLFAIGHSYQGRRGVVQTGVVGALMTVLYMISGSLYVSMLLHALVDAYSGTMGRRALNAVQITPARPAVADDVVAGEVVTGDTSPNDSPTVI